MSSSSFVGQVNLFPGLQIWRIESMKMVEVPQEQYGSFYEGDSYIVLFTKGAGISKSWNLHFWLGNHSSQDEKGAAAILTAHIDDKLGGRPVQYREIQEQESSTFRGYFKHGITYKQGGVESGFKRRVTNLSDAKRLIHVKGRRNVTLREVEMHWKSFNQGDIFIVDIGNEIYQWNGSKSNRYEKLKACEVANAIKNEEKGGKGTIVAVNEGENIPAAMLDALQGEPADVTPELVDEVVEYFSPASLYRVSSDTGKLLVRKVSKAPFRQADLYSGDCFIVDNGNNGSIFVWKGKSASLKERQGAMENALKFISKYGYPPSTNIQVMAENSESVLFTQFFKDWKRKDQSVGFGKLYTMERVDKEDRVRDKSAFPYKIGFDVNSLYEKPAFAAEQKMVDDGSGKVEVWRVKSRELFPILHQEYGRFFSGECYVILYTYTPKTKKEFMIYCWQGLDASNDDITASAFLSTKLDDSYDNRPVQVRVVQGKEPKHMLSVFKHPIIISSGNYVESSNGSSETPGNSFYQVRSTSAGGTKLIQVESSGSMLNSNDAFLLKHGPGGFIWVGTGASELEVAASEYGAERLGLKKENILTIKEGNEHDNFWILLGGKKSYASSPRMKEDMEANPPRMFAISSKKGRIQVEELPGEFTQSDLEPEDVLMLDTWDQIFIWFGDAVSEEEIEEIPELVKEYISKDPRGRDPTCPILQVRMNFEPVTFTGFFPSWDTSYFDKKHASIQKLQNLV